MRGSFISKPVVQLLYQQQYQQQQYSSTQQYSSRSEHSFSGCACLQLHGFLPYLVSAHSNFILSNFLHKFNPQMAQLWNVELELHTFVTSEQLLPSGLRCMNQDNDRSLGLFTKFETITNRTPFLRDKTALNLHPRQPRRKRDGLGLWIDLDQIGLPLI